MQPTTLNVYSVAGKIESTYNALMDTYSANISNHARVMSFRTFLHSLLLNVRNRDRPYNHDYYLCYFGEGHMSKRDIFFNIIFVLSWLLLVTLIGIFIYGYIEGRLIL